MIHDIEEEGTGDGGIAMDISTDGVFGDVYVYNNTIARGGIDSDPGMRILGGNAQQVRVENNIFYYNNNNDGDVQLYVQPGDEDNLVALGYNTYYTSGIPYVFYYGSSRLPSSLKTYNLGYDATVTDPGFTDPNGDDNIYGTVDDNYTLGGINIDDGKDLSQCFDVSVQGTNYHMCYNDALDPVATNWSTNPPTVVTTKQESPGSWERGAYVYEEISGKPVSADKPVSVTAPGPPDPVWVVN